LSEREAETEAVAEPATLLARAARIDLARRPLLARLDVESRAKRLGLLGDWSALFRLLTGEAELAGGSLTMAGAELPLGVQQGTIGVMRLDPLLPPAWTAEHLLAQSAELAGLPRKHALRSAFQTLEGLGLVDLSSRHLGHLHVAERRAVLVAHALLTGPRVVCLEEPLAGLDTAAQQLVLAVIERAAQQRSLVVAFGGEPETAGTRELLARCDERLSLRAGVVVQGYDAPEAARFTATVCRNHHAFAEALTQRGLTAHPTHEAGILDVLTSAHAGPAWRYLVELSDGSTAGILDAALETDAGLLELIPA
jgi:ABC-type Na+ transport system ATPase subunit NatA